MTASRQDSTIWQRLAAPVPPASIQWRPDGKPTVRDGQSMVRQVAYIDAQVVRSRLDAVVPGEWDLILDALPPIEDDGERLFAFKARLQVLGVVREDVGVGKDYKAAATDAFKRAAVRFGIAHELYELPIKWVPVNGATGNGARSSTPAPAPTMTQTSNIPPCPKCGGRMWDNRANKRNNRAPDFKCRDRSCDGVVWPDRVPAPTAISDDDLPF